MSKKSNKSHKSQNYNLKSDAVNRLKNADKMQFDSDLQNSDPAKKYRSGFLDKIPSTVKALFIKFWFAGAVCFFILWGLGIKDSLDSFVIVSIVLGIVNDVLVNNALRFIEVIPNENAKWMMFPKKSYWTFFFNILYSFAVFYCVRSTYVAINTIGQPYKIYFAVEPILFGILYVAFDVLFIFIKRLFQKIINDAKNKVDKK